MGTCCQGPAPPTQHETQIEHNQSNKSTNTETTEFEAKYSRIATNDPEIAQEIKKQTSNSLPYKTRSPKTNIMVELQSESNIVPVHSPSVPDHDNSLQMQQIENENKQLKEDLENEQHTWSAKYKKLQETLDNQALNYSKEIDIMRKQMMALQTELQQQITIQENEINKSEAKINDDNKEKEEENIDKKDEENEDKDKDMDDVKDKEKDELHVRKRSDMVRRTQLLDLTKEFDILREETNLLKTNNGERDKIEAKLKQDYEEKINRLEEKVKSLEIVNEPHAKPSFTKKTQEKNRQELTEKDEEINKLREEISKINNKYSKLEIELKEQQHENDVLFERSKTMTDQLNLDKETIQNELKLLRNKDEGFINKIYKQRDQYKMENFKLKKKFKERELTLKVEMEALERKKIKAEDLADLKDKTDEELREIVEKLKFTNRDLNDQVEENKLSHNKREKEFDDQILGLNNIIKNLKEKQAKIDPGQSTRNITGLSLLAGSSSITSPRSITANLGKQFPKPPKASGNKFSGAAAALAGKLPFGGGKKKKDAKAALNAALLKKQGKDPNATDDKHHDDVKGAVGALFAKKQAETKQSGITGNTTSLFGVVDAMAKYNKMKKIGMPMASIKNKMKMDGFNAAQIASFAGEPPPKPLNGIDLSKHDLKKYEKMKKIGMPETSVRNKMKMDGIDKKVIATFFGEKLDDDDGGGGKPMEPPCPKPDMKKYAKMKKIGMPEVSVKNKMKMDGIHEYWVRDFFGEPQPIIGGGARPMEPPCPKPDLKKYTKMKKVGLPIPSVKNKMKKDGIHEYWVRDFFGEPQPMVGGDEEEVMKEPCPKPDTLSKYTRMKKIGMPDVSVKNKMKMDGIHEYWVRDFFGEPQPKIKKKGGKKKKAKRKVKALHWRKKSDCDWTNTIWANIDTTVELKAITTEKLITPDLVKILETAFSSIRPKKKDKNAKKKKDEKKEITLIDPKRAFNMIVGLRQFEKLKITDIKIRNYLLMLDDTKLTVEMLENLSKFVPSNEELTELRNFKGNKEKLGRAEKFTDAVTCMVDIKMRIDLWEFKIKFKANVFEVESRINTIKNTLDTLKNSPQIASFLKICLIIGNFMNEGTNRGGAKGIKLESIDRFASLKTADNKTTMLMFILDFMYKNHNTNGEFNTFPKELFDLVESSKKIEAKTIRDGIADMKDSLERIGKRITRTSRNLQQVQEQFYKSAGNVLVVFNKLKHNVTKLKSTRQNKSNKGKKKLHVPVASPDAAANDDLLKQNTLDNSFGAVSADIEEKNHEANTQKKRRKGKGKAISFVDDLLFEAEKDKEEEKYSKYRNKKPRKFLIIDENYKGDRKIRKHKPRELSDKKAADNDDIDNDGFNPDLWDRGETIYESDTDYHNIGGGGDDSVTNSKQKRGHVKTQTGLRRKKKKLKKVKIRRMRRVRRKDEAFAKLDSSRVSIKTARTIQALRDQKSVDASLSEMGIDTRSGSKRKSLALSMSLKERSEKKEDPSKPPKDKFESMMTGFHTMAMNKVEALDKEFVNLKIFAGNVAVFYGEHDDLEWEELFMMFINFFELVNKAKKQNADVAAKKEKQRKKEERERLKKEKMAKRGLKPKAKIKGKKSDEPENILDEIKMRSSKGTLKPSKAKNDIVGYEKDNNSGKGKVKNGKKKKKKNGLGGMSLLGQIKKKSGQ